jgi:hypothetical protein
MSFVTERRTSGVVTPAEQEEGEPDAGPSSLSLADEAAQAVKEHELDRRVRARGARGRARARARAVAWWRALVAARKPLTAARLGPCPLRARAAAPHAPRRRRELLIGKRISAGSFALVYAGRYRKEARHHSHSIANVPRRCRSSARVLQRVRAARSPAPAARVACRRRCACGGGAPPPARGVGAPRATRTLAPYNDATRSLSAHAPTPLRSATRAARGAARAAPCRLHTSLPHAPARPPRRTRTRTIARAQLVAIKVLRSDRVASKDFKTYIKEVELIQSFNHPHVLRFVGVCCDPPHVCIGAARAARIEALAPLGFCGLARTTATGR